ncbi:hypothetical protein GGR56DRAFT_553148 [Xylariaceae sp. FL0804]|nr:hypothetical protein GGR56DRAFT_553148 [Xylariaceae sp. FL0804]
MSLALHWEQLVCRWSFYWRWLLDLVILHSVIGYASRASWLGSRRTTESPNHFGGHTLPLFDHSGIRMLAKSCGLGLSISLSRHTSGSTVRRLSCTGCERPLPVPPASSTARRRRHLKCQCTIRMSSAADAGWCTTCQVQRWRLVDLPTDLCLEVSDDENPSARLLIVAYEFGLPRCLQGR